MVARLLALVVTFALLLASTSSVASAASLTFKSGSFDVADGPPTNLTDSPVAVPAGAETVQVVFQAGQLTSGNDLFVGYQVGVHCQPTGGGPTVDTPSAIRQFSLPKPANMFAPAVNVTGCSTVMLDHHIAGSGSGAGRVTVTAYFQGASLAGPNLPGDLGLLILKDAPPDPNMLNVADPVQSLTGNFTYSRADVVIPGRGPTPSFVRSYNSGDTRDGSLSGGDARDFPFGPGWTHNYMIRLRRPDGDTTGAVFLNGPQGRQDKYTYDSTTGAYSPPQDLTTTLTRNGDLTFTATHKDNSAWTFDAQGRLTGIKDRHGNLSTLTYNGAGRLDTIGDPAGRGSLILTYDGSGRLSTVTDWQTPNARVVEFGYDSNTPSRLHTVTDREGNVTTYAYDGTSQRLTSITDDNGHVALSLTYDGSGRVATQKDAKGLASGQQSTLTYVTNGDGTKTTTASSPVTSFEPSWSPTTADTYDTQDRIIRRLVKPTSSSADDILTEYTYYGSGGGPGAPEGQLATAKDGRGNVTTFCYDVDEHGAAVIGSWRNLTRRIDPAPASGGNVLVTLFSYDLKDNPTRVIPPKGVNSGTSATCTTDFSSSLNLTYATTMTYDGMKLASTTRSYTDPDIGAVSAKTTFEYDANQPGMVSYVTPPQGNTGSSPDHTYATLFTYFGASDPSTKRGLLKSVTTPAGTTTFDYDAVGRRTSMVDPNGNVSGATPADHTWTYAYDKENRLRFARAPAPTSGGSQLVTESRYDGVGNLVALIDANGQVTRYLYDERDSLSEVWESPNVWTDPATTPSPKYVTAYQYDHTGNLTRVTRASGDSTYERAVDYAYDGLNRVRTEKQYPSWPSTSGALVMQTTYDKNSNRATATDQLSRTTTYSYDRLNRLTGVDYSDAGTPDVAYTYDANGNRLTMVDGTGKTAYCYDELSRLLSVTTGMSTGAAISCPSVSGGSRVGYRYDRDGNRTKLLYPNGDAVTYAFDKASRLQTVADWASRVTGYTYFPDGALQTQTNVNGTVGTYTYDNARRLTEVWNKTSTSATDAITRHQFTMDAVGNRTQVAETLAPIPPPPLQPAPGALPTPHPLTPSAAPGALPTPHPLTPTAVPSGLPSRPGVAATTQTLVYGYDRLYRLTSASGGPAGSTTYTYDPVGNRLTRTRGSVATTYSYDRADRIASATTPTSGTSYTVDAVGNMTMRGSDALSYDQANRLTGINFSSPSTLDASYAYDGDGKRTSKTVGSTTTSYVYDANRSLPVLLEDGSRRYVWGLGLAYEVEASAALVYHVDGLGSVRAITNASKAVVQTYETDEFGVPITASGGSTQPFTFTGEQRDPESSFVYLRDRQYDPALGRFISRDSVVGHSGNPQSLNRFAYVQSNPVNYADPSGHDVLGNRAHEIIEIIYERIYGIKREQTRYRPDGSWYRIDLVDYESGQFWEIKPWYQLFEGQAQVKSRVLDESKRDPSDRLTPGGYLQDIWVSGFDPGIDLHAWFAEPGLVLYEWRRRIPVIPFKNPIPEKNPKKRPWNYPRPYPGPYPEPAPQPVFVPIWGA